MPYHVPRLRRGLAALLGTAAVLAAPSAADAATATKSGSCPVQPATKVFSAFGDSANYFLAPGGSFEAGSPSWTLTNAAVDTGNETSYVHGAGDTRSLTVRTGGQAVSPAFCVDPDHPGFRLFVRRTGGNIGRLWIKLRVPTTTGGTRDYIVGTFSGSGSSPWQLTDSLRLSDLVSPLAGKTVQAQVVVIADTVVGQGATWAVDDIYLDPYAR